MHGQRLLAHALLGLVAVLLLGLAAAGPGKAQVSVPAPAPKRVGNSGASLERVIGEVTATNPAAKQIELKMDAGGTVTIILQDNTLYLRVPPGETDLKNAVKITLAEIGVGDRVYARGRLAEDQKSIPAVAVIVMTKADLAQQRERERAEWQKRGVAGTISALNPETKEITISVRSPAGTRTLIIEPSQETVFRRYAPDSVRFVQAKPSSFAELKVGDALRILGEKNSDGTRITPEEIVAGSFRNIAGIVNAIDAAAGEIRITDLQSRRPLTVQITSDTMIRRMPPTKAATPATRPQGGGGLTDPERMPMLSLRELKGDEAIIVLCTVGTEPSRVTAIVVVAGVEPLLGPALQDQTQVVGPWNFFDISVPW